MEIRRGEGRWNKFLFETTEIASNRRDKNLEAVSSEPRAI